MILLLTQEFSFERLEKHIWENKQKYKTTVSAKYMAKTHKY